MSWDVEYTDGFEEWWNDLELAAQESVAVVVGLLEQKGPSLGFRYSSDVRGSRHGNLRELRIQHRGHPYRVLYAFDSRRTAILLLGGSKKGDERWYGRNVRIADWLWAQHVRDLKEEGG